MNSAASHVLTLPRSSDRPAVREHRGLWFDYRNARMWGKPVIWSLRYAREATVRFS